MIVGGEFVSECSVTECSDAIIKCTFAFKTLEKECL